MSQWPLSLPDPSAGAWLLVDNTYEDFIWEEGAGHGARHHCVAGPHVIHIFSFSKVREGRGWGWGCVWGGGGLRDYWAVGASGAEGWRGECCETPSSPPAAALRRLLLLLPVVMVRHDGLAHLVPACYCHPTNPCCLPAAATP